MVAGSLSILLLIWIGFRFLRGTTLMGPWAWAVISLCTLLVIRGPVATIDPQSSRQAALDYMAAISTLCPAVALLGAKRPQHRAWQWIVASLWLVLALPAAESLWLQRSTLQIHDARGWFLWLLILVGLTNHLPTRFAWPAFLFATAQVLLLMPHLPLLRSSTAASFTIVGPLLLVALVSVAWGLRRARRAEGDAAVWIDFRNGYGAAWALRVMERVNTMSHENGWDVELTWSGLVDRPSSDPAAVQRAAGQRCLNSLLKRFVSDRWLRDRVVTDDPGP